MDTDGRTRSRFGTYSGSKQTQLAGTPNAMNNYP